MRKPKSKPNGKDHDVTPPRGKQKPRSHRVRHPKEAAAPDQSVCENAQTPKPEPENPVARAAAILEEERQAAPVIRGLSDSERDELRAATSAIEAAGADLARATKRRKEAQVAFDKANAALVQLSIRLANGTSQPGLPFDAAEHAADRDAMLQADREANTPALIERLRRARYLVTREQLDALDHTARHQLAEYVKKCEAAILDGSVLNGVVVPALLASMHVADEKRFVDPDDQVDLAQYCTLCGCMLRYVGVATENFEGWLEPGIRIGSDCAGVDLAEERTTAAAETSDAVVGEIAQTSDEPETDDAALEEQLH